MSEQWVAAPGFPMYEVSNMGRLRRSAPGCGTRVGRVLRGGLRAGYPVHSLMRDGIQYQVNRHPLVAEAFHGPRPPGHHIDHINGDRRDCRACNLEYVTPSENALRAVAQGRMPVGEDVKTARLTEADVREIRRRHADGESQTALAAEFGVVAGTVGFVVRRETWRHV